MNIPFFNYQALFQEQEDELVGIFKDVGQRGAFIMQRDLAEFEEKLASYLGVKHAIGVADGTMALSLSLRAAGIQAGDEVIVPSHTFIASAAAIHHAGGIPLLVECGQDHLIDPNKLEGVVTDKTRGIMPVQLNGRVANMDKIMAFADKHGLFVVEDSCQALGAKFKDRYAGTFGDAGTFSFFPAKTLGCLGDGGAVVTNSDKIANQVKDLRDHGRNPQSGMVERWGFNGRLDNLQAAILAFKLDHYGAAVSRRRQVAKLYQELLADVEQLLLPPAPNASPDHFDVYQNYEIEAENRDELQKYLTENGIGTIRQWGGHTIHQFGKLNFNDNLPYTETMTEKFLLLPLNTSIKEEEVKYIGGKIHDFYSC